MAQTDVPLVKGASREDIDRWGQRFVAKRYPQLLEAPGALPVQHLIDVVLPKYYNIDHSVETLPAGVYGVCEPPDRLIVDAEVYDSMGLSEGRARFTGAHEAVHAIVHLHQLNRRFESSGTTRLHRRTDVPSYRDPEWQANRGAAALLMPASMIWRIIDEHHGAPEAEIQLTIAKTFSVSLEAAGYRLGDARNGRLWRPAEVPR